MAQFNMEQLNQGIKERIKIMESFDYDTGPKLNKTDLLIAVIVGIVCIVGMIWGLT
jgi:hypothetical protein